MGYHWLVLRWLVTRRTLQVQVNLKSSTNCALLAHGSRTHHWRSFSTQWRRVVGAAVLRGTGLISSVRAGSGHRRYPRSVLRRIAFIVFAQKVGLALGEIAAELAKLPTDRIPARQDWARLSGAWTKRIDQRIAELQRLRAGLTQCIGCGCLSIDKCKLANPADRAGRRGPGPRYWLG